MSGICSSHQGYKQDCELCNTTLYNDPRFIKAKKDADAAGIVSPLGVVTWKARKDGVRVFDQRWTKERK